MARIEVRRGDILRAEADALVNTVNCVGVMGRGIALQFKRAFPDNFKAYKKACDAGEVVPGRMFVFERKALDRPRYIINFPTKRHWRGKSRIEDIEAGLEDLLDVIRREEIATIAIPPLGAGLGGLDWKDVRPLIEDRLQVIDAPLTVYLYEPGHAPTAKKMTRSRDVPNMTDGRAALVLMIQSYVEGMMEPDASLLEVHKLMYFLQEAGEPLRLNYTAHHRGPYATNLTHVLNAIEGHMVSGYADGGDNPDKALELVPGALDDAKRHIQDRDEVAERIDRVRDLVDGYESQYALELLASVYWLSKERRSTDVSKLAEDLRNWNDHKAQLYGERQVAIAMNTLHEKGWLNQPER